jgi:hypothetical protein
MLREHPEISGFRNTGVPEDEGQHLQTVFPPAKAYGGPGRFGFVPEAHLTEESSLITLANKHRLFEEWSRYWDITRTYLLEKSPPNIIRTRFLQSVFPGSYFIVIYRHPIAVSLATAKWTDSSLDSLVKHWLQCHRLFELDRPHLRNVLTIKYEDLIADTQATLQRVYRFLGLAAHASSPLNPAGNDRYFDDWRALSAGTTGHLEFRHIVAKYEQEVLSYGYSLLDYGTTMPAA